MQDVRTAFQKHTVKTAEIWTVKGSAESDLDGGIEATLKKRSAGINGIPRVHRAFQDVGETKGEVNRCRFIVKSGFWDIHTG